MEPILLEGGTIRTLDPAAPTVDRLAIAGGRIVAEPAPGPRRVDLEGRCVLPGLNDAHVHFPTWSLAQRQVRLEGVHSLAEAVGRVADRLPAAGWLRGLGWRDADWTEPPSRAALDAIAPDTPVILTSKDYHSLWLNSAALAHAGGDLDAPGGVVERDAAGEPTGILRENAAWRFRDRHAAPTMDEMLDACRAGLRIAASRGVTAIHDKDGWVGSLELFQRLRESGELTLRVWQSIPAERLPHLRELGLRSGFGDDLLRAGYLKVFMDGTLGSATARLLDGSGVEITSSERLAEIVREAAAAGWPVGVHAIGDAANRAALDAFEATAARAGGRSGCASGSSTPSCSMPPSCRASRRSGWRPRSSSATHPRTATSPTASGRGTRAPTPTAPSTTPGRGWPTGRMRPWRSSTRSRESRPACCARSTSGPRGAPSRP